MPVVTTQFPAKIDLGALTPRIGFTINGERMMDQSGYSVSGAGDINGDGIDDVIIGTSRPDGIAGASYAVFGSKNIIGGSGSVALDRLDGKNGFKIFGVTVNDRCGTSVSNAGDINNDGITDLIIGADKASYVIFGAKDIGGNGAFGLDSLNGQNGFVITTVDQYNINLVSAAGDINNDTIADLIIGASNNNANAAGASYVVFGATNIGNTGTLALANLNGQNGFVITAIASYYVSSVSIAGDVNADGIADLIIGTPYSNAGTSYVVFGGKNIGGSGTLSSLNGHNGFTISGVSTNDNLGWSVSGGGDINADGIDDFIIEARAANNFKGATYVIFGAKNIGASGSLSLSNLNRNNGFIIAGKTLSGNGPVSISIIGDINADGAADILIRSSAINENCVIFGGKNIGDSGITCSGLIGSNGFIIKEAVTPYCTGTGWGVHSVSRAGDINHDGIDDFIMGSSCDNINTLGIPSYSYLIFGSAISSLTSNTLTIARGETVFLNSSYLNATYFNATNNPNIRFSFTNVQHGYFHTVDAPTIIIMNFLQRNISNNDIQFTHDGSNFTPTFCTQIGDGGLASMSPQLAEITFIPITIAPTSTSLPLSTFPNTTIVTKTSISNLSSTIPPATTNETTTNSSSTMSSASTAQLTTNTTTITNVTNTNTTQMPSTVSALSTANPITSDTQSTSSSANIQTSAMTTWASFSPSTFSNASSQALAAPELDVIQHWGTWIFVGSAIGAVGVILLMTRVIIACCMQQQFNTLLEEDAQAAEGERRTTLRAEVTIPLAKKIFSQMNTTGFMGYRSSLDTHHFISAIEQIIVCLGESQQEMSMQNLSPTQQIRFFNEIIRQIKRVLLPSGNSSCCVSMFKPDITAQQLEDNASTIAHAVIQALQRPALADITAPTAADERENVFDIPLIPVSAHN